MGIAPDTLEREKEVFYLGSCLTLGAIRPFVGEVFGFERLFLVGIGAVAMRQVAQLLTVVLVSCADTGAVHDTTGTVYTDMSFHAEVPMPAFAGGVHLGVTRLGLVLGGVGRGNEGGIDYSAA